MILVAGVGHDPTTLGNLFFNLSLISKAAFRVTRYVTRTTWSHISSKMDKLAFSPLMRTLKDSDSVSEKQQVLVLGIAVDYIKMATPFWGTVNQIQSMVELIILGVAYWLFSELLRGLGHEGLLVKIEIPSHRRVVQSLLEYLVHGTASEEDDVSSNDFGVKLLCFDSLTELLAVGQLFDLSNEVIVELLLVGILTGREFLHALELDIITFVQLHIESFARLVQYYPNFRSGLPGDLLRGRFSILISHVFDWFYGLLESAKSEYVTVTYCANTYQMICLNY